MARETTRITISNPLKARLEAARKGLGISEDFATFCRLALAEWLRGKGLSEQGNSGGEAA